MPPKLLFQLSGSSGHQLQQLRVATTDLARIYFFAIISTHIGIAIKISVKIDFEKLTLAAARVRLDIQATILYFMC